MPVRNSIANLQVEVTGWRRDFHQHPELMFVTHRTAASIAEKLRSFGCDEVVTGIGRTGVVGVIMGKTDSVGKVNGLRADMDALPIAEATGLDYASQTAGLMHVCGHEGHSAMVLGAANIWQKLAILMARQWLSSSPPKRVVAVVAKCATTA